MRLTSFEAPSLQQAMIFFRKDAKKQEIIESFEKELIWSLKDIWQHQFAYKTTPYVFHNSN